MISKQHTVNAQGVLPGPKSEVSLTWPGGMRGALVQCVLSLLRLLFEIFLFQTFSSTMFSSRGQVRCCVRDKTGHMLTILHKSYQHSEVLAQQDVIAVVAHRLDCGSTMSYDKTMSSPLLDTQYLGVMSQQNVMPLL